MFALIRTRFILLVTLMYTFQSYYVFRGKGRVVVATTSKSIALITKRPIRLYKQLAELCLLFIVLLMMLALSAVLVMEFTLGAL